MGGEGSTEVCAPSVYFDKLSKQTMYFNILEFGPFDSAWRFFKV